jgi:hypothetical protein
MANLYITDRTEQNLDTLLATETRSKSKEIEFLIEQRLIALNLPVIPETITQEDKDYNDNLTQINNSGQEKNTGVA